MDLQSQDSRDKIQRLLLKRVLYRIDYTSLSAIELDSIILEMKKKGKDHFDSYNLELGNNYEINLNTPSESGFDVNKAAELIFHVFRGSTSEGKFLFKISNSFAYLEILPTNVRSGNHYYFGIFTGFVSLLASLDFFTLNRLGMRKTNQFMMSASNITSLKNIFSDKAFLLIDLPQHRLIKKRSIDSFSRDIYNINIINDIVSGKIVDRDENIYIITFDFDIYINDQLVLKDIVNRLSSTDHLDEMNNVIYSLFIKYIDPVFLKDVLIDSNKKLSDYGIM